MRSLGWALIQYNWCLFEKDKFGCKDIHKGKTMCRHREKMATYNPMTEAWNRFIPHSTLKEPTLLTLDCVYPAPEM
jgi:hypothetical protein